MSDTIQEWIFGDYKDTLSEIPNKSIDFILTDPPYGVTQWEWDKDVDFNFLWKEYKRIMKKESVVAITAVQPFTTTVALSNIDMFKYTWTWKKNRPTGHLNANRRPMRITEDILIFYDKCCKYNPQFVERDKPVRYSGKSGYVIPKKTYNIFIQKEASPKMSYHTFPTDILEFPKEPGKKINPTQKPVALFEYLIKTYTDEEDWVHDTFLGSGTTLEASKKTNRNCIGIELDSSYEPYYKERLSKYE